VATTLSDDPDFRMRVSSEILKIVERPLKQLLPFHRCVVAAFVTKRASTTQARLPLHQDWWIVDNRVERGVNCWCPLVDVGPDNGCLRVVPGVHRLLNQPYPIHPKFRSTYHPKLRELDEACGTGVPMAAGAALIYDQRMLHGSGENLSDRSRVAFNCITIPNAATPLLYQWDDAAPDRIEVLEVDEAHLCHFRFGRPVRPPYPGGVRLVDMISASDRALDENDIASLRVYQQALPRLGATGDA
jgi:ectoine hydroxylase-related dioxygenase (phytanoyl-CoA dioxygenase family)